MPQLVLATNDFYAGPLNQLGATQTARTNPNGSLTITQSQNASNIGILGVTINGVHPNQTVTINYNGTTEQVVTTTYDIQVDTTTGSQTGTGALLGRDGTNVLIGAAGFPAGGLIVSSGAQSFGAVNDTFAPAFTVLCFAEGTLIQTVRGEVAVEQLRTGDRVVTAFGEEIPIAWIGHRRVDCAASDRPRTVQPIRVRAGAFGAGRPWCDLWLSPDHAVHVETRSGGGMLVPVRLLVNGDTIVQETMDAVTYYHVELPAHDVLLANGLPAESYLDTGGRTWFDNGGGRGATEPGVVRWLWETAACAPIVVAGPGLAEVRAIVRRHAASDQPQAA